MNLKMRVKTTRTKLLALALLFAACAGSLTPGVVSTHAKESSIEDTAGKVSTDLAKLDKDFNADAILQLNGPMSAALSDFIKKNISLKESFPNLDAHAIKHFDPLQMEDSIKSVLVLRAQRITTEIHNDQLGQVLQP